MLAERILQIDDERFESEEAPVNHSCTGCDLRDTDVCDLVACGMWDTESGKDRIWVKIKKKGTE